MTLIIAAQKHDEAFLVSDLKMSNLRYDRSYLSTFADNYPKIVIWLATDGLAVSGYSGNIFQRHEGDIIYTDEWMASAIHATGPRRRVFPTLHRLRELANERDLEILTVGWKGHRRRRRRGMFKVGWLPDSPPRGGRRKGCAYGAIGDVGDTDYAYDALLRRASADHPAVALLDALRWRAQQTSKIGESAILVGITPGTIRIQFFPGSNWRPPAGMAKLDVVTNYLPAIVTSEIQKPLLVAGRFSFHFDPWKIEVAGCGKPTVGGFTVFHRRPSAGGKRAHPASSPTSSPRRTRRRIGVGT